MNMYAKRIHVAVIRSQLEKTPVTIFEHELKLMEILHGGIGAVEKIVPGKDVGKGLGYDSTGEVVELNVDEEYARLGHRYGNHPEQNISIIEYVYRTTDDLKKAGVKKPKNVTKKSNVASINPVATRLQEKMKALDISFDDNADVDELEMTLKIGLMEVLDGMDVEYKDDADVGTLIDLYDEAGAGKNDSLIIGGDES